MVYCVPYTLPFPTSRNNSLIPRSSPPPTVKLQVENAWGTGNIGYQMYAGVILAKYLVATVA